MRRIIRYTLLAVAALLAVVLALWSWSRLQPLSTAQREAVALLQPSPEPAGRNAFDALWLLGRDVPATRQRVVADADMARIRAELADSPAAMPAAPGGAVAGERDLRPSDADRAMFCRLREDCLQRVQADPGGYAALVRRNRVLLDRVAALSAYDFYRGRLPPDMRAPMPDFTLAQFGLTDAAQAYASGDIDGGLSRACAGVDTWRRLGARADSLVVRMLGAGLSTDGYGTLLARMLVQLPAGRPLPPACNAALAPVAGDELSICDAMRGEYAMVAATSDMVSDPEVVGTVRAMLARLVYDPERSRALMAENMAPACTDAARASMVADQPLRWPQRTPSRWRLECAANLAGCVLADIASPAYVDYASRVQDAGARLELLRGVVSVRGAGDPQAKQAALRRFWTATGNHHRELRFVEEGRAVGVREFHTARGEWWQLPLPAAAD